MVPMNQQDRDRALAKEFELPKEIRRPLVNYFRTVIKDGFWAHVPRFQYFLERGKFTLMLDENSIQLNQPIINRTDKGQRKVLYSFSGEALFHCEHCEYLCIFFGALAVPDENVGSILKEKYSEWTITRGHIAVWRRSAVDSSSFDKQAILEAAFTNNPLIDPVWRLPISKGYSLHVQATKQQKR